jgi:Ca2+-binding RTX toxin-like protein
LAGTPDRRHVEDSVSPVSRVEDFVMLSAMFRGLIRGARRRTSKAASSQTLRFTPAVVSLEQREVPAVLGVFALNTFTVIGDHRDNTIQVSRDAAGNILVNGGAVPVYGGTPTVTNTTLISVFGRSGDDVISLDEANGALPRAVLFGGSGNDVITGGAGDDVLYGQAGADTLLGKGGNDLSFGGSGNDVLTGGTGDDAAYGEAGNDRMIWNPGDGSDLNEGGAGYDTVVNNGGNVAETYTITANGGRVRLDRLTPGPFSLDIGTTENLVLNGNGGDDTITASDGLDGLIKLTLDGGAGNDTITGGDGDDVILGGDGDDVLTGGPGYDTIDGGSGNNAVIQ